jgi:hypothetical protein
MTEFVAGFTSALLSRYCLLLLLELRQTINYTRPHASVGVAGLRCKAFSLFVSVKPAEIVAADHCYFRLVMRLLINIVIVPIGIILYPTLAETICILLLARRDCFINYTAATS